MNICTAGQIARLIHFAESRLPGWRVFFHPMASAENTKQAWSAMRVHPVREWYLKSEFYRGEAVQGLRQLFAQINEAPE